MQRAAGEPYDGFMAAPMKQCPRCAEMVLAEAMACRFCGYDPAEVERAQRAEAVANDRWVTLLLIFVVIPAAVLAGWLLFLR